MHTQLPSDERNELVLGLLALMKSKPEAFERDSPKLDLLSIIVGVIEDEPVSISRRARVISILKKSPYWKTTAKFLVDNCKQCATPGCNHSKYMHNPKNKHKKCSDNRYIDRQAGKTYTGYTRITDYSVIYACKCDGFRQAQFK